MSAPSDWMSNVAKSKQTRAMKTAAKWNMPGGGYDQWKKGDPQREKDLPIGSTITPIRASGGQRPTPPKPAPPAKKQTGY